MKTRRYQIAWLLFFFGLGFGLKDGQAAVFRGLGRLAGDSSSDAMGVSGDGSVIVGRSNRVYPSSEREPFRWTKATGMVGLGTLPGGERDGVATGVSGDGSVVVGYAPNSDGDLEPFRWTGGQLVGLGDLPGGVAGGYARGVSADGQVVVGQASGAMGGEAFRWTPSDGMTGLGDLAGGIFSSRAAAVSGDGSMVVGYGYEADAFAFAGYETLRWTADDGAQGIGNFPEGSQRNQAWAVSRDGRVLVGHGDSAVGEQAFLWTEDSGVVVLGDVVELVDVQGAGFRSAALGVSGDGTVVVGSATGGAMIWDAVGGMRLIRDELQTVYGIELGRWELSAATGISDDGNVIVGYGINPEFEGEAWMISLNEVPEEPVTPVVVAPPPTGGASEPLRPEAPKLISKVQKVTGRAVLALKGVISEAGAGTEVEYRSRDGRGTTKIGATGRFRVRIKLEPGRNVIKLRAVSESGQKSKVTKVVVKRR